jgi:hypothetical protein
MTAHPAVAHRIGICEFFVKRRVSNYFAAKSAPILSRGIYLISTTGKAGRATNQN